MATLNMSGRGKRTGFIVLAALAAIIIVVSGVVLVRSAKLHTGATINLTKVPKASALSVTSASETPLAAEDTSAILQGANSGVSSADARENSGTSVSARGVNPSTKLVCDKSAETRLVSGYDAKMHDASEYHKSLLSYLSSEGQLLLSNENSRYDSVVAKLRSSVNSDLAGVSCPAL